MSVIRAVATMLVLVLALSVLFKISSPPSAAQVQAATPVIAKLPVAPIAAASPPAASTAVLVPKVIPGTAQPAASPNPVKPAPSTAWTAPPQTRGRTVATSMPSAPVANAQLKAQQAAQPAASQQQTAHREQQRAAESNPSPHPRVSHLSLLPRTGSKAPPPGDHKSSASTAGGRKSTLSSASQPPAQRDRYAMSSQDREVSRPSTMAPGDRRSQSRDVPPRSASLYDTRRYDRSLASHAASRDAGRQSLKSDGRVDRFNGRVQISERKRRTLLREYEETARRQLEIQRELGLSVPKRASQNARYSDASARRQ